MAFWKHAPWMSSFKFLAESLSGCERVGEKKWLTHNITFDTCRDYRPIAALDEYVSSNPQEKHWIWSVIQFNLFFIQVYNNCSGSLDSVFFFIIIIIIILPHKEIIKRPSFARKI